jgi:hypothetical protein
LACVNTIENYTLSGTGGYPIVEGETVEWFVSPAGIKNPNKENVSIEWKTQGGPYLVTAKVTSVCSSNLTNVGKTVTIGGPKLSTPGAISRVFTTTCINQQTSFSVSPVAGASAYRWISNSTTTSSSPQHITTYSNAGNYIVSVEASNGYCWSDKSTVPVEIQGNPTYIVATGPTSACQGPFITFTAPFLAGHTYKWTYDNAVVDGPSNESTIKLKWNTTGNKKVDVQSVNSCGVMSPIVGSSPMNSGIRIEIVEPNLQMGSIDGSNRACLSSYLYSLTQPQNISTLTWSIDPPSMGTVQPLPGSNPTKINITWTSTGTATVTALATNACGSTQSVTLSVIVQNGIQPTAPAILGPSEVCLNSSPQTGYAVPPPDNVTYSWAITGTNGTGTLMNSTFFVAWSSGGTSYITVTPYNGICTGNPSGLYVNVGAAPVAGTLATSIASACVNGSTDLIHTGFSGVTSYERRHKIDEGGWSNWVSTGTTGIQLENWGVSKTTDEFRAKVSPLLGNCPIAYTNSAQTILYSSTLPGQLISLPSSTCSDQTLLIGSSNSNGDSKDWKVKIGAGAWTTFSTSNTPSTSYTPSNVSASDVVYYFQTSVKNGDCPLATTNVVSTSVKPRVTLTAGDQTICSGTQTDIPLTSNIVATYSWTVKSATNVTGATAGSGSFIRQVLTNSTNNTVGTVVYTVKATGNGCASPDKDVTVMVNPLPVVIAADKTICGGVGSNRSITSSVANSTFSWIVKSTTNVTSAAAGSGSNINQVLTCTPQTAINGTAIYTITATANTCAGPAKDVTITVNQKPVLDPAVTDKTICSNTSSSLALISIPTGSTFGWTATPTNVTGSAAGSGSSINQTLTSSVTGKVVYGIIPTLNACTGTVSNITVNVNPLPDVLVSDQTICSDATSNVSITSSIAGTTFSWIVKSSTGATGASSGNGSSIQQTLSNLTTVDGVVVYTITPVVNSCTGNSKDVTVTVRPKPVVTAADQTICSGATTNVLLNGNTTGVTKSWTVKSATNASGASSGTGDVISQTLTNSSTTTGTVTYSVTPSANGCSGTPIDVTVTVMPTAIVIAPDSKDICSGESSNISLTSNPAGATFSWTAAATNVAGASSGSGSNINQTLTSANGGDVVYTITPSFGGCLGTPKNLTVNVKGLPVGTVQNPTTCSGVSTTVQLAASIPSTFSWVLKSSSNLSGTILNAGTTSFITNTYRNVSGSTGSAVYEVTPQASGCNGLPYLVTISVKPEPVVTTPDKSICSGQPSSVALTSNVSGSTFTWTVKTVSNVSGAVAGSGSSINQTLTNTTTSAGYVIYGVTASANGCTGAAKDVRVTVNTLPTVLSFNGPGPVCPGNVYSFSVTLEGGNYSAYTYVWTKPSNWTVNSQSLNTISYLVPSSNPAYGGVQVTVTRNGCSVAAGRTAYPCGTTYTMKSPASVEEFDNIEPEATVTEPSVYPNPASAQFTVHLPESKEHDYRVSVYSQLGKTVFDSVLPKGTNKKIISTSTISSGVYFVCVRDDKGQIILHNRIVIANED